MALIENIISRYKTQTLENANKNVLYDFQVEIDPPPSNKVSKDITNYVISISSIPSYSLNMDNINIGGLFEFVFPKSLTVTGTLSLTILDSHSYDFYKNYVYDCFINQKIFTITLMITNLGRYVFYG